MCGTVSRERGAPEVRRISWGILSAGRTGTSGEACNFWHSKHRVLKDEREPLPWPVPGKARVRGSARVALDILI